MCIVLQIVVECCWRRCNC